MKTLTRKTEEPRNTRIDVERAIALSKRLNSKWDGDSLPERTGKGRSSNRRKAETAHC